MNTYAFIGKSLRDRHRSNLSPNSGRAGTWGTWVVTYTVGAAGIATGGGLQVALPERWHQWWRNSARRVQSVNPTAPFYVTAHTDRHDVRLQCEILDASDAEYVKPLRRNIGYPPGSRYAWTVSVTIAEGALQAGETIDLVYGDMSHGGRGFTPPLWTGSPERVRAAIDTSGGGEFALLPDCALPLLNNEPGPPVELLLVLDSRSVVGEEYARPHGGAGRIPQSGARAGHCYLSGRRNRRGHSSGKPHKAWECKYVGVWGVYGHADRSAGALRLRGTSHDGVLYGLSNPSKVI